MVPSIRCIEKAVHLRQDVVERRVLCPLGASKVLPCIGSQTQGATRNPGPGHRPISGGSGPAPGRPHRLDEREPPGLGGGVEGLGERETSAGSPKGPS